MEKVMEKAGLIYCGLCHPAKEQISIIPGVSRKVVKTILVGREKIEQGK